jgi:phosphoglycolate phosphatase-like HAD superfamily hydrolase
MRRAGLRIYLATSKREVFDRRILENLKLATCFDRIYGSVPGGKLDQKPELLAHILSEQDKYASHSLMVGDRARSYAAASAAIRSTEHQHVRARGRSRSTIATLVRVNGGISTVQFAITHRFAKNCSIKSFGTKL